LGDETASEDPAMMVFCPEGNAALTPLGYELKEFAKGHGLPFLGNRNLRMTGIRWFLSTGCGSENNPHNRLGQRLNHLRNRRTHPVIGASTNNLMAMVAMSSLQAKITSGLEFSGPGKEKLWQRKRTQGAVDLAKNKPSRSPRPTR